MLRTFEQYVMDFDLASSKDLPLAHCTSGGTCFEILAELRITPSRCKTYNEDLLYLFYGRPAYKPRGGIGASTLAEVAPVCFVLDPSALANAARIFPFDSGGFNRYEPFVGPNLKLENFHLGTNTTAPLRLIKGFYETTQNYFRHKQLPRLNIAPSDRAASAYAKLLGDPSISDDDDRRGTIEIQMRSHLNLETALLAVVAPPVILDDPQVLKALGACPKAVPIEYPTYGRMDPRTLSYALYDRLDRFFTDQELFL